jgi:hypothetical protein
LDLLDFDDELRFLQANPALLGLLEHYTGEGKAAWKPRRSDDQTSDREMKRLHAMAIGAGWLEPSAGNPDAPEEFRFQASYRLTRLGRSALAGGSLTAA